MFDIHFLLPPFLLSLLLASDSFLQSPLELFLSRVASTVSFPIVYSLPT